MMPCLAFLLSATGVASLSANGPAPCVGSSCIPTAQNDLVLMQTTARRVEGTLSALRSANMSEGTVEQATETEEREDCTTLKVGGSGGNTKSVSLPSSNYVCPVVVDRHNWIGADTYGDTFRTSQEGARVTVSRTDSPKAGWGMALKIRCCKKSDGPKLSTCLFLHGAMVKGARPTQFKPWYGDVAGALRTYWGPFNVWYADLCEEFLFSWAETETNAWTDAELQNSYADKADEVIRSGGVVFAHSMANAILAGACWQRGKCVQWYSLGGGYSGQAVGNAVLDILNVPAVVGLHLMNTKVFEGFDFESEGMRHDSHKELRNAMAKVVDEKGLLKGSVCGINPAGAALSGETKAPDWGLDFTTALKHELNFDQHAMGVAMLAAGGLVQNKLKLYGDDERNDGLVEVAACAYWEDANGRHWYGTGSEWKTVGPTADPSETHVLAEINHIEECGVFPQTSVAQNWIRNMMCRELKAQGKACPAKSIAMEWPAPSGRIGEACLWPVVPCSDGQCCSNKGHSICQHKLKDYVGIEWCPADCQGVIGSAGTCEDEEHRLHWPRRTGEWCIFDSDCENWMAPHHMGCCQQRCHKKKRDWAGVMWCPDVCKNNMFAPPGSC